MWITERNVRVKGWIPYVTAGWLGGNEHERSYRSFYGGGNVLIDDELVYIMGSI